MRREMTSDEIQAVCDESHACCLAMVDDGQPVIVPVNFAVHENTLYFHSNRQSRKVQILRKNPQVSFQTMLDMDIVVGESACAYGARYRSVIGCGTAEIIEDPQEQASYYDILMLKIAGKDGWEYGEGALARTAIVKVPLDSITGKLANIES